MKQLLALHQLPADAVNQEMPIDGAEVEQEHPSHETAKGLGHYLLGSEVLVEIGAGEQKRRQCDVIAFQVARWFRGPNK
jgi:hypothetical protein